MKQNICKFIPTNKRAEVIHTINFVYDYNEGRDGNCEICTTYRMYYVLAGEAYITLGDIKRKLKKGDVFLKFPSKEYVLHGNDEFECMYVSFLGIRANIILDRLGIDSGNFVFENMEELEGVWKTAFYVADDVLDLSSESVLLYTLAKIGDRFIEKENYEKSSSPADTFSLIKEYIDNNFSSSDLSLGKISNEFSYTKKYLSAAFKKHFKISITDYICMVRINHACLLVERHYTEVKEIAFLCGFDDQLYFSKVFKKMVGISPRDYIKKNESVS